MAERFVISGILSKRNFVKYSGAAGAKEKRPKRKDENCNQNDIRQQTRWTCPQFHKNRARFLKKPFGLWISGAKTANLPPPHWGIFVIF